MRLNYKSLLLGVGLALALLGTGCSGINARGSVSPATFFLPGIMKADPPPAQPDRVSPEPEPAKELARL